MLNSLARVRVFVSEITSLKANAYHQNSDYCGESSKESQKVQRCMAVFEPAASNYGNIGAEQSVGNLQSAQAYTEHSFS